MPTGSRQQVLLVDTSAAVPLVSDEHAHHEEVFAALADLELGLAGHAAFETFSVLTRRPLPLRMSAQAAVELLEDNFPHSAYLSPEASKAVLSRLARTGIAGGAVYDALVAATAVEHGLTLVTRDRRALPTYQELGADVRLL